MTALEARQKDMDELLELLRDVRGALSVFVKVGNAFRWLMILGGSVAAAWYAFERWLLR